jgi:hypothetical protein
MANNNGVAVNNAVRTVQPAYGLSNLPQGRIPPVLTQANKQDLYVYGVGGLAAAASFTDRSERCCRLAMLLLTGGLTARGRVLQPQLLELRLMTTALRSPMHWLQVRW